MLDILDELPWRDLPGCGGGEDMPRLLRAIASGGNAQRDALDTLFDTVWHQGTVYEGARYVVPFLIELAAAPTGTRRDEIVGTVGTLADGAEETAAGKPVAVSRTRSEVWARRSIIRELLRDRDALVRAGAAYVLSRFPEAVAEIAPLIRKAAESETDALACAGMIWCLGSLNDGSDATMRLLDDVVRNERDFRKRFAAAVAAYRIRGELHEPAAPIYAQLAGARWYADHVLVGLPWDYSADVDFEDLLADVEPDAHAATATLLDVLRSGDENVEGWDVAHDLLALNFPKGDWRAISGRLSGTQRDVLRAVVETNDVWADPKHLWFLVPDGNLKLSSSGLGDSVMRVRDEMRAVLADADETHA